MAPRGFDPHGSAQRPPSIVRRVFDIRRWMRSRRNIEQQIDDEFCLHLDLSAADIEPEVADAAEARTEAERRFGSIRRYRNEGARVLAARARRQARASFVGQMVQDLRLSVRVARRTPLVTGLAVLALALGIGANTAVFSVLHAVLIPPMPYPDVDRLVQVRAWYPESGDEDHLYDPTWQRFVEFRDQATAFESIETYVPEVDEYLLTGMTRRANGIGVSSGFLSLLGVEPYLGRLLAFDPVSVRRRSEITRNGAPPELNWNPEMMLGYDYWVSHFGADPGVLGTVVEMESVRRWDDELDTRKTIVGVLPPDLRLPLRRAGDGVVHPWDPEVVIPWSEGSNVYDWNRPVIGKLRPGVSLHQAQRELEAIAAASDEQSGDSRIDSLELTFLADIPGTAYGRVLGMLWAVVAAVLLISCLNVACLLLARSVARDGEFAVRASVGGSRGQLVRQLFTESALLAVVGGAAGLVLAWIGTRAAITLFPGTVHGLENTALDGPVLGATLALSLFTVLLFGWAPPLVATRVNLSDRLKGIHGSGSLTASRALKVVVAAEVSLALVLFAGAGLLANSFVRLASTDPGFETENVVVVQASATKVARDFSKYGNEPGKIPQDVLWGQLMAAAAEVPGVVEVAAARSRGSWSLPLGPGDPWEVTVEDHDTPGEKHQHLAAWAAVSPGYFDLLEMPLLAGRGFTPSDNVAPHDNRSWEEIRRSDRRRGAVIVSETAARQLWHGGDPLGQGIVDSVVDMDDPVSWPAWGGLFTVVGVVGDVSSQDVAAGPSPVVYRPIDTACCSPYISLTMKTRGDPVRIAGEVRDALVAFDEDEIEIGLVTTMDQAFSDATALHRFHAFLMGLLAVVALLLVLAGVYGVLTYLVSLRTHELGIRLVLGAERREILARVLRQGLRPVAVGLVVGLAGAFYAGRFLDRFLYGVESGDPWTLAATALLVLGMGLLACFAPALRASGVDPIESIRGE